MFGLLAKAAGAAAKLAPRLLPKASKSVKIGGAVVATGVAADVVFDGGEHTLAPLAENLGETTGRSAAAFGSGLTAGALDQILGTDLPGGDGEGGNSTYIMVAIVIVAAILLLRR